MNTTTAKAKTQKVYQERINKVWIYIQNRLDQRLSLDELSAVACVSPYHFHRIFSAYTGESLNQYIKRLRLERAANELQIRDHEITQIALDCGYETPAAFSKAFKQQFGVTPSAFRSEWQEILERYKQRKRMTKEANMEYTIVKRPEKRVLSLRKTGDYMESAPIAWQEMDNYAMEHGLFNDQTEMIGICHDSPEVTDQDKIRYDAAIPVDDSVQAEGEFSIQTLRGGEYAMFVHNGPYENLYETYDKITHEWLSQQERELADAPVFEKYVNPELMETNPEALRTEIYLPLK